MGGVGLRLPPGPRLSESPTGESQLAASLSTVWVAPLVVYLWLLEFSLALRSEPGGISSMPVQPPALGVGGGSSPQQSGGKRHLSEYPLRDSLNVLDTRSPSSSALLDLSFKDAAWPSRLPTTLGGEECLIPVGNPSPTIESRAANKPCLPQTLFREGPPAF